MSLKTYLVLMLTGANCIKVHHRLQRQHYIAGAKLSPVAQFRTGYDVWPRSHVRFAEVHWCVSVASSGTSLICCIGCGLSSFLLQILLSAVNDTSNERFSDLHHTVSSVMETFNFWADLDLSSPLSCLASSLGITEECDLALVTFLNQMNLKPEELQALTLFPTAAAALFVSDRWLKSVYIPPIEAFGDNEHIIPFATAKLSVCFHALITLHDVQAKSFETSVYTMPMTNKIYEEQQKFKLYADQYLRVAAQVLLSSRATEVDKSPHLPYRAMGLMLESFIRH